MVGPEEPLGQVGQWPLILLNIRIHCPLGVHRLLSQSCDEDGYHHVE